MPNADHVARLRDGADAWNRFRRSAEGPPDLVDADLSGARLAGADLRGGLLLGTNLRGADLRGATLADGHVVNADLSQADLKDVDFARCSCLHSNLLGADLRRADLRGAKLHNAVLTGADLRQARFDAESDLGEAEIMEANLSGTSLAGASLLFADLRKSDLGGADLRGANLGEVVLTAADLTGADLSAANLAGATLIRTRVEGTRFRGARVYGVSVWDLRGTPADESDLVVTPQDEPTVTVGDLEVAQFVYLLLNNAKIRDVIDTVTAKAVLILGRFSAERKAVLDAIRERLSAADYVPIIFDFDKPARRDLTETISTLAHLSRFVIADVTEPKSVPQELTVILRQLPSVPVQPILLAGRDEWSMFDDLKRTGRVLETFRYRDVEDVERRLAPKVVRPAEAWIEQFAAAGDPLREIERLQAEIRRLRAAQAAT